MCDRWFHLIGPKNFDIIFLGPNLKSVVTYIQILIYYSTFVQTNVSQLQSFRDEFDLKFLILSTTSFVVKMIQEKRLEKRFCWHNLSHSAWPW